MWNSSRRIVLLAAVVLSVGMLCVGIGWLTQILPIEFGPPESGTLADSDPNAAAELASDESRSPVDVFENGRGVDGDPIFQEQTEPPIERPRSGRLQHRSDRPWVGDSDADSAPLLLFPSQESTATADLPERFPSSFEPAGQDSAGQKSSRQGRINLDTTPHEVVQQTGFDSTTTQDDFPSANGTSARAPVMQSGFTNEPRTLAQASRFPADDRSPAGSADAEDLLILASAEAPAASGPADKNAIAATLPEPKSSNGSDPAASPASGTIDLQKIDRLIENGELVGAQRELSGLYWNDPDQRPLIQQRLERNAQTIYFSPQPHFLEPYVIQSGDKLQNIAAKYHVSWQYLAMLNRVDPKRIRVGQKLKVIKGPFAAFVDLSEFELTVHAHGFFVKRYRVGVGKDGSSPLGKFTVLDKIEQPQYTDPNGKVTPGGDPTNPLGTHWVDIGNSYGLHGTIEPESIGKAESRGCIRMRNEDIVEVYNFLVKGSEVVIRP